MAISLELIRDFFISSPNGDILAKASIVAIAFLVMLITTFITKLVTNQNRMKELKDIQKACQIKLRDNRGNPEEAKKINEEVMKCNLELMKHSFKPMLFTFIPLLLLWSFMGKVFATVVSAWVWWYIISGLIFSIALKKILKVY
ncbi:MAG: EMC3/TMCO1 family protein [Candidatus Nanoarchaeia archaeon]|nr:EMC3/TMCO1 family protein [Candidatus Nanoarchaeia archaeon]